jgi:phenylalanyl-tRNA synthetase alpha chain
MKEKLLNIKNEAISLILAVEDSKELEDVKLRILGRNGSLTEALKGMAQLPQEDKPEIGRLANEVKNIIEDTIQQKKVQLTKHQDTSHRSFDVTDPGIRPPLGHLHLVTQAIEEITTIFQHIGFTRVRHPEIEWDWYAFTALNFPENHPARDEWETFFINQKPHKNKGTVILTPHTSSGQIRELEKGKFPIKMLNIAKTYRRQSDVSHTPMFHQFEGLVVGENISIAHLKGTLDYFTKSYFGDKRISRIRPYHFQFTEPSFEVDVSCGVCNGTGYLDATKQTKCKLCKSGWVEIGGAGMVHPNVLKNTGVNPEKYTGFAFGWGVERVLMMKEDIEIDDLRLLYANDINFLQQF